MRTLDQIITDVSRPGDIRKHIKNLFIKERELLDVQTVLAICDKYPEFADLISLLPIKVSREVATKGMKNFSKGSIEALVEADFFNSCPKVIAEALLDMVNENEMILIPVMAQFLISKSLDCSSVANVIKRHAYLIKSLFSLSATPDIFQSYLHSLDSKSSRTVVTDTMTELGIRLPAQKDNDGNSLVLKVSKKNSTAIAKINSKYDSTLIKELLESQDLERNHPITKLSIDSLLMLMSDDAFSTKEKESIFSVLEPELCEKLVASGNIEIEYLSLQVVKGWPTEYLTKTQLEICNNLKSSERDEKIKSLFIHSVKDGELVLTADSLRLIKNNDLYVQLMKVVGKTIKDEGTQSYLPSETINAILEVKKQPMPEEFFILVLMFNKDWTKLDREDQIKFINYAMDTRLHSFTTKKMISGKSIMFKERSIGIIVEKSIQMIPSLEALDEERKELLKKIANYGQGLPHSFSGSFVMKTRKFIPSNLSIPVDNLDIRVELDTLMIENINKLSENIIIHGLSAKRRGSEGSIVFEVSLGHDEVFETISRSADIVEKAKALHEKIKILKKDTSSILESMALIDSNEDRKFGIELELASNVPRAELAKKLGRGTISSDDNASKDGWNSWSVKFDLSVGGESVVEDRDRVGLTEEEVKEIIIENGGFSAELVSPVLQGKEGIDELKKVLNRLNKIMQNDKIELEVGEAISTGLHVHHSIEDLVKRVGEIEKDSEIALSMGKYLMSVQGALYALCSKWRLGSVSARPLKSPSELKGDFRYGFAISKYGTLEYRLKEATFNSEAIIRWVVLTQQITASLLDSVNNEIVGAKKKLKEALDGGIEMILAQEFDEASQGRDLLSHLAYYQAATDFAMMAV
jgi:hypothetical protein